MNFPLTQIPERSAKPRREGVTMIMDKGLSVRQAEDFLSVSADYTDIVKLGWATSVVTPNLKAKLDVYRKYDIPFYFGGTLLEAFYIRGQIEDYIQILHEYGVTLVEVSDGSIEISEFDKCNLITRLAKENFTVLSEVGSKDENTVIPPYKWVEMMQRELDAGSWKVIAEARESGTVGMFRSGGEIRSDLIEEILKDVPSEKIMWEAPQKSQQVWFIKLLGSNVNLGNIAPAEAIPLETLRLGLRGDTFHTFLDN
ncbi:phosphosulfolactate synthase [Pontibacter sp. G13]|uniref:phosphosulfolactate synthase n=1 Tax=Pontibacter sp. G13 TaxID=3074898 RepID=UPI00288C2A7E|nr:phosphosulfolactate synthase [Pontibacter sp. G13]WNJ21525.1 phosphosulfolactate synthase [Pontibacter sp. G13]